VTGIAATPWTRPPPWTRACVARSRRGPAGADRSPAARRGPDRPVLAAACPGRPGRSRGVVRMSRYRAERHLMGASARRSLSMAARTTSWYAHDSPRCDTKGSPRSHPNSPAVFPAGVITVRTSWFRAGGSAATLAISLRSGSVSHLRKRSTASPMSVLPCWRASARVASHSGRRPDRVRMTWTAVSSAICLLARN
jgi:hypothetical protein